MGLNDCDREPSLTELYLRYAAVMLHEMRLQSNKFKRDEDTIKMVETAMRRVEEDYYGS